MTIETVQALVDALKRVHPTVAAADLGNEESVLYAALTAGRTLLIEMQQPQPQARVPLPDELASAALTMPELVLYDATTNRPYVDIAGADLWMNAEDLTPKDRAAITFMVGAANYLRQVALFDVSAQPTAEGEQP